MKKRRFRFFTAALTVALALAVGLFPASADSPHIDDGDVSLDTPALGDLTNNGTIDSDDLTLLARIVARIDTPSEDERAAGDVTKNGTVDSDDLTLLAQYVARIISEF